MTDGPLIAQVAALIGDPARANILTALMDGRALTASELSQIAGVSPSTTSGHLGKLETGRLLATEKQGRHRYFRLANADVAHVLESLMGVAQRTGAVRFRTGPKEAALREARICYDHLAGERGVELLDGLVAKNWLSDSHAPSLTGEGQRGLGGLGIDVARLTKSRRPVCRSCLDWSERRIHLGGSLGAALLSHMLDAGWAKRDVGRVIRFSPQGTAAFRSAFEAG